MAKVTSKLQVTIPKALAERFAIKAGDEIDWIAAGDTIRIVPAKPERGAGRDVKARLRLFDRATARQANRRVAGRPTGRGWAREELYRRGRAR